MLKGPYQQCSISIELKEKKYLLFPEIVVCLAKKYKRFPKFIALEFFIFNLLVRIKLNFMSTDKYDICPNEWSGTKK